LLSGALGWGTAFAGVLGHLETRGNVQVVTADGPSVSVANTVYAYFGGDRIVTNSGAAVLEGSFGRLGLAENSAASAYMQGGALHVKLEKGTLAYALEPGAKVLIHAGGMTLSPQSAPLVPVAKHGGKRVGWVSLDAEGNIKVMAREGKMSISYGEAHQVVNQGQAARFAFRDGRLIRTQVEGAAAGGLLGGLGGTSLADMLVLSGLAAGGAFITYKIQQGAAGQERPASP
ncbi:MAG: hypothetical protein D6819_08830, partial [Gammaproteobacteria bacterium]